MWKRLMKELNLSDSYISMGLGLLVVIIVGVLLFNYFSNTSKPSITDTGEQTESEEIAEESPLDFPRTHVVQAGDTLWSIAEKYYQSGYNWVDIANENNLANADNIEEGAQILIPNVTPIATPASDSQLAVAEEVPQVSEEVSTETQAETTDATSETADSYTVQQGDYLWAIAEKIYSDGYKWVDIANANNLDNPDIIHAGNVLVIPR